VGTPAQSVAVGATVLCQIHVATTRRGCFVDPMTCAKLSLVNAAIFRAGLFDATAVDSRQRVTRRRHAEKQGRWVTSMQCGRR
jgi:hypothetical protein